MEFLASEKAQQMYADVNGEYPITEGIELSQNLKAWGPFKQDNLQLEKIAENRAEAIKMASSWNVFASIFFLKTASHSIAW